MIGIIGAMDEEVVRIKEKMDNVSIINKAIYGICIGTFIWKESSCR